MRTMTGSLSVRGAMIGSKATGIQTVQVLQSIDDFLELRPGGGVANEQPPILNLDIIVEHNIGRGIRIGDKSVLVERDRGQPHRIERGDRG